MKSWREDAACRGRETALWYPTDNDESAPIAVAICADCPVRQPCLEYALAHEDLGIWAGTSARWRRRQRRAMGIRITPAAVRTRGRDWVAEARAEEERRCAEAQAELDAAELEEAAGW